MNEMRKLINIFNKIDESSISKSEIYIIYPEGETPASDERRYIFGADIPLIKFANLKFEHGRWLPDSTAANYVVSDVVPRDSKSYNTYVSWAKDTKSFLRSNADVCGVGSDGKPSKKSELEKLYKPVQLTDEQIFSVMRPIFSSKYPNTEIYMKAGGEGTVITTDSSGRSSYTFGNKDDHFLISLNGGGELGYDGKIENMIHVYDAVAGNYSGVITDFLDALFEKLESEITPRLKDLGVKQKRILNIDSDKSYGAWKAIAKRLGATYHTS
jgi:hypothetical protein